MNVNHGEDGVFANLAEEEDLPLPGFRFHPTDEELLRFYLRRKVDKKPMKIELIKQIDIYKYDPWDLPKTNGDEENESYFFCKRGRKYRNSIRPNRVTKSGFWKATGIDKSVNSHGRDGGGDGHDCIGLKKTLVYYQGAAGKGTKTDWMMHEFRLPTKSSPQEAEVWTICRIFKRNASHKNYISDWRKSAAVKNHSTIKIASSQTCSVESNNEENYINFGAADQVVDQIFGRSQWHAAGQLSSIIAQPQPQPPLIAPALSFPNPENDFFTNANWDELRALVEFAIDPFLL